MNNSSRDNQFPLGRSPGQPALRLCDITRVRHCSVRVEEKATTLKKTSSNSGVQLTMRRCCIPGPPGNYVGHIPLLPPRG
jgi:hypothetical protein